THKIKARTSKAGLKLSDKSTVNPNRIGPIAPKVNPPACIIADQEVASFVFADSWIGKRRASGNNPPAPIPIDIAASHGEKPNNKIITPINSARPENNNQNLRVATFSTKKGIAKLTGI